MEDSKYLRRSKRGADDSSLRSPTQRDRDRVLYSESFRRLGGVTQVAFGTPDMSLHNRLVHSLKVEQVGTSIVSRLSNANGDDVEIDSLAVAAACLGHDLGHPPFGHAGEQELNRLVVCDIHRTVVRDLAERQDNPCTTCTLEDGFEGNAQTFRILSVLGVHRGSLDEPIGLDLTRASLAASSKYPWTRGTLGKKRTKWGAYDCDIEILNWVFEAYEKQNDLTLEAQIMDWADDITYAVHDIEDFYRVGLIPIDDYRRNNNQLNTFKEYISDPDALGPQDADALAALDNVVGLFPSARFNGTTEDIAGLDELRSTLLTRFISTVSLLDGSLVRDLMAEKINAILKQLTWFHIIDEPRLSSIQTGQQRVLRDIYKDLVDLALPAYAASGDGRTDEKVQRRLPQGLRRTVKLGLAQKSSYNRKQKVIRGVLDYIASLSDAEAYRLHAVLRGREVAGHL
jgi:dGTPase